MSFYKLFLTIILTLIILSSCSILDSLYKDSTVQKSNDRENFFSKYDPHNVHYKGHYKIGKKYKIKNKTYVPKDRKKLTQFGEASWYGGQDHGKLTANGDTFNKYNLTAAHPTLPLPSIIEVENLENKKKIILLVNDRGPFAKQRVLDVSEYAAKILDFKHKGSTKVRLKLLTNETDEFLSHIGLKKKEGSKIQQSNKKNKKYSINAHIVLLNIKLLNNLRDLNKNYF